MPINFRADSSTPERKRSLIRSVRGIPWWGIIALYFVVCCIGMVLSLFNKELGIPFALVFIACAVSCAVLAEFDALFTAFVMPILGYLVAYPTFYLLDMAATEQKGMKVALVKVGLPFVTHVPTMLIAFCIAGLVVLSRVVWAGMKYGWHTLWVSSLLARMTHKGIPAVQQAKARATAARAKKATSSASSTHPERTATKVSTRAASSAKPARATSTTTPRPRPIAHTTATEIPRVVRADDHRSAPAPFNRYPGQQPPRPTGPGASSRIPPRVPVPSGAPQPPSPARRPGPPPPWDSTTPRTRTPQDGRPVPPRRSPQDPRRGRLPYAPDSRTPMRGATPPTGGSPRPRLSPQDPAFRPPRPAPYPGPRAGAPIPPGTQPGQHPRRRLPQQAPEGTWHPAGSPSQQGTGNRPPFPPSERHRQRPVGQQSPGDRSGQPRDPRRQPPWADSPQTPQQGPVRRRRPEGPPPQRPLRPHDDLSEGTPRHYIPRSTDR